MKIAIFMIFITIAPASAEVIWSSISDSQKTEFDVVFRGEDGLVATLSSPQKDNNNDTILSVSSDQGKTYPKAYVLHQTIPLGGALTPSEWHPYVSKSLLLVPLGCSKDSDPRDLCITRSADQGRTWTEAYPLHPGIFYIARDNRDPLSQTFIGIGYNGIYESLDAGKTWNQTQALTDDDEEVIDSAAYNNGRVALHYPSPTQNGVLIYSDNGRENEGLVDTGESEITGVSFITQEGLLGLTGGGPGKGAFIYDFVAKSVKIIPMPSDSFSNVVDFEVLENEHLYILSTKQAYAGSPIFNISGDDFSWSAAYNGPNPNRNAGPAIPLGGGNFAVIGTNPMGLYLGESK